MEGRPIHYLTTERDLPFFVATERTARGSGLLALARPRFEPGASAGDGAAANPCLSSFEDLPATEAEVNEILAVVRTASPASKDDADSTDPLVLVGEEDAITPPAEAEAMASEIHGSQLVVVPRAGHLASLEQPEAVNAAVSSFLVS